MSYQVDNIGGHCPVQADGVVDGLEFYFRARGSCWSMSIGTDPLADEPDWYYQETYREWPAAGWMTPDEARALIDQAVARYRAEKATAPAA